MSTLTGPAKTNLGSILTRVPHHVSNFHLTVVLEGSEINRFFSLPHAALTFCLPGPLPQTVDRLLLDTFRLKDEHD